MLPPSFGHGKARSQNAEATKPVPIVWLTETGGIVRRLGPTRGGDLAYDEDRAARALGRAFELAALYRSRVARMYLHNWRGTTLSYRWDSGLARSDGSPRPYFTAKAALQTPDFRA